MRAHPPMPSQPVFSNICAIARTVWLEFRRRKDFYAISFVMALFTLGATVARIIGIENAATANFLMAFGLSLSYALAAILAAWMAGRQIPNELERRTIHPLLAKPVSRGELLLGKMAAVATLSAGTLIILAALAYLPLPKSEEQRPLVLIQMLALQSVSLGVLTTFATGLSIYLPSSVATLLSLAFFFAGSAAVRITLSTMRRISVGWERFTEFMIAGAPDFSVFNHVQRFVGGGPPIEASGFFSIVLYGFGVAGCLYLFAVWTLNRKSL